MAGASLERAMREPAEAGHGIPGWVWTVRLGRWRSAGREPAPEAPAKGTLDEIRKCSTTPSSPSASAWPATSTTTRGSPRCTEGLPASPAAAVTEFADYEWRSSDAREKYDQIKDFLGRACSTSASPA